MVTKPERDRLAAALLAALFGLPELEPPPVVPVVAEVWPCTTVAEVSLTAWASPIEPPLSYE